MKDKAIHDAMDSIENHVKDVYNQGYSDGLADGNINSGLFADRIREAYNNGLEEAWECARKILFDGSLSRDILTELGADSFSGVIHKCSASEAIEKIKEYEKRTESMSKAYAEVEEWLDRHLREELTDNSNQAKEKTVKSCCNCRFFDLTHHEFPCSACSASHTFRWEARKGASE